MRFGLSGKKKNKIIELPRGTALKGRYVIGETVGAGGFSIVYRGYDPVSRRSCAIKECVLDGGSRRGADGRAVEAARPEDEKVFAQIIQKAGREANILNRLQWCPEVVRYYDFFQENETAYLVMEFLEGDTLGHEGKRRRISFEEATDIVCKTAWAVERLHSREKLLHRDLTPENIFLTNQGEIKLIDFGSAGYFCDERDFLPPDVKLSFAPPEQYQIGARQGRFSDVYSLAATYYCLLTGERLPKASERAEGARYAPLEELCPEAGSPIARVVDQALVLDQKQRTQTMEEFLAGLLACQKPVPREKRPAPVLQIGFRQNGMMIREWAFPADRPVRIGRLLQNDIVMDSPEIGRSHCQIWYDSKARAIRIEDFHSLNGTYLANGGKVMGQKAIGGPGPVRLYLSRREYEFIVGVRE